MSYTSATVCTKLRAVEKASGLPMIRHWSYALTSAEGLPGRSGVAICGLRGVVDQVRALHLARQRKTLANIKIHEMRPCRACLTFVNH